ncbi:MAG: hypothetical protein ACP5H2_02105 [Solirubrobacteraceae bacterium]
MSHTWAQKSILPNRIVFGFVALLSAVAFAGPLAASAAANSYTALLSPFVGLGSNGVSEPGGWVYGDASWTAPSGTAFEGFAYTHAGFDSSTTESVGGISAGFGAGGSDNQPTILFPFTQDCAITNSKHLWARNNGGGPQAGSASPLCDTTGETGGWNDTNSEILNTGPSVHPGQSYQTLWLTMFCQAATCAPDDAAYADVSDLSAKVEDPNSQPTGQAAWASAVSSQDWYQTDSNTPVLSLSASDPAGVCGLGVAVNGPAGYSSGDLLPQPATITPNAVIGTEFTTTSPCGSAAATADYALPAGMSSGAYQVTEYASNPGDYQDQGMSEAGAPAVASIGSAIKVDDTVPTVSWASVPPSWTAATSEELYVTVGPSGLGSLVCTDNQQQVAPTLVSGSQTGAGTSEWTVPTPDTGTNQLNCTAVNNDANGALTGSATQTFNVDDVSPVTTFSDPGYTPGSWTTSAQTVTVDVSTGPSGLSALSCNIDGLAAAPNSAHQVVISGNGKHTLTCLATSFTGLVGISSYTVWIDAEQPTVSFLVNGQTPSGSWLSGTPTVQVLGSESGGVLSGLSQILCTVTTNGQPGADSPITLSTADGGLVNNTGSFELTTNGQDTVSCVATNNAGTVQTVASSVVVNVDNPLLTGQGELTTIYGSSPDIDNGHDPYSNGPSPTTWYRTPQSVTITANDTGGGAPIVAIQCKGALVGSWANGGYNADPSGGEQITVTVQPPGGELSCTAQDAAGNSYPLGAYLFQIDATAPTGHFVDQSRWPAPNVVEVAATDNGGSGIAYMRLYATNSAVQNGMPQPLGEMTYNRLTGYYQATVPDGVAPFTAGAWVFFVNAVDVAGNSRQIVSNQTGGTETLVLPLLDPTALTAQVRDVHAVMSATVPDFIARAAGIYPGAPETTPDGGRGGSLVGADVARSFTRGGGVEKATRPQGAAFTPMLRSPEARGDRSLTVSYGSGVTLHGVVFSVARNHRPVRGARVKVYEQVAGASGYQLLGVTVTNAAGGYFFKVRPGASRRLFILYPGSRRLRPAVASLSELSKGRLALSVSQVHAGGVMRISGRVLGGHIPRGGVSVTIAYRQAGAPGQGVLGVVRTSAAGRFSFVQPFARTAEGLTYLVWSRVPAQPGWPYLSATTAPVSRLVR